MNARRSLNLGLLAAATTAMLSLGCATAPPVAEKMVLPPMGTVDTFHRKSSGSLGNYDGQVVWTFAPTTWQGKPAISFGSPQAGASILDPATFAILAGLNTAGQPVFSYDPPMDYRWPLEVGKTWTSTMTLTMLGSGQKIPLTIDSRVEAWEDVTVPAGTFKAYRVSWRNNLGEAETRWLSPQEGHATLKRHVERPASHPQGAGVLDAVLLSRVLPAK